RRSHALAQTAPERRGDPQAHRQGGAEGIHPRAARPALLEGAREAADRARQGQEAARQARDGEGAGLAARAAAVASQARMKKAAFARLSRLGWLMGFEPTTTGITISAPC